MHVPSGVRVLVADDARELLHERDREVAGAFAVGCKRRKVDPIDARCPLYRRGCRPGNDVRFGFGAGEGGFHVEHALDAGLHRQGAQDIGVGLGHEDSFHLPASS
jgi:hypothetical protein